MGTELFAGTRGDTFEELARFYESIMEHVDYPRWYRNALLLSDLLPSGFRHLDAACGTGKFLRECRKVGWDSMGVDLSAAMLREGRMALGQARFARADLRALPFAGAFDFVTCLFDSVNFVLNDAGVAAALSGVYGALRPGGLLYFDVVTERMVLSHFDGQQWTEDNGRFRTTWESRYDRKTKFIDTRVRVNTGAEAAIRERVHDLVFLRDTLAGVGFKVLAVADAATWRLPKRKTIRVDIVAWKPTAGTMEARFRKVLKVLRAEA